MSLGKPGPFQVIEEEGSGDLDKPIQPPRRRYSCENYENCLDMACALNWDSFTCRGCSGDMNEALLWRSHVAKRKDNVAKKLCQIPEINMHETIEAIALDESPKIVGE